MLRAPAAWLRRGELPACVRGWPSVIVAVWWGERRAAQSLTGPTPAGAARWLGWVLTPREWREVAPQVLEDVRTLGAAGVVLNPEEAWLGADDEEARELVTWFRSRRVPVAVSSYGLPEAHPSFPWAGFGTADVGIAQTYDRRVERDASYADRARAQYRAAGFTTVLVSVGLVDARQRPPQEKSAEELRRHLALRPRGDSVVWGLPRWSEATCRALAAWGSSSGGGGAVLLFVLAILAAVQGARSA